MHNDGVRSIHLSIWNSENAVVSIDTITPLTKRIKDLGWHIQLHMSGEQIVSYQEVIESLGCTIVVDHFGRLESL